MNSGIYAIKNTLNGKAYIGQAVNIERRINQHFRALSKGAPSPCNFGSRGSTSWNKSYSRNAGETVSIAYGTNRME